MTTVAVLGASGFIGTRVLAELTRAHPQWNVRAFAQNKKRNCHALSILEPNAVRAALHGVNIVFHLVASQSSDPLVKRKVIEQGTRNVVAACKKYHVSKLVFLSSYAARRAHKDVTGVAKKRAESLVRASRINYAIIQPTLVYGKGGRMFEHIVRSTRYPLIPVLGDGMYMVAPVFVNDLARVLVDAIKPRHARKTYTVTGTILTYNAFVREILKAQGRKALLLHIPTGLIIMLVRCLHVLRILPFDERRVLRAMENVQDKNKFVYRVTPLRKGLQCSLKN